MMMKKLAARLFVLAVVGVFLAGCAESDSVRPVYDGLAPGMTETQVEQAVGFPATRDRDSWRWIDLDQHHEDVTITWGKDGRVSEVTLSDATPGGDVKKRKPPATPAATEKPKTSTEPPAQPAQPVGSTGNPAETLKECRADCPTRTTACATNGCTCPGGCLIDKQ